MKSLVFYHRQNRYEVDESGRIKCDNSNRYSSTWIFLGGSSHHWHNRVTVTLKQAFENPSLLNGCYGWDRDNGTTRKWAGRYYGKTPKITGAHIVEK